MGNGAAYQAFRYAADLHTYTDDRTPWVRLTRIKGYPAHYSNTAESARTVNSCWLRKLYLNWRGFAKHFIHDLHQVPHLSVNDRIRLGSLAL